ncbi:hypothetical protein BGZ70_007546 [Mortierella alpina]|uniref:FAD-binding domain-containing protein n=1 Tax=Mortierella alpina TaxID=64518 RepID=A0A9P6J5P2_MORAP|nr:hypothetical protein BGZ70_007546 [Mortierella alpina]
MTTSTTTPSSSTQTQVETPVLISGAGPAGLYAAILLTKLNIPCRLIERHLEISPLSKALVIHSRTMEIFGMSGIVGKFLERGRKMTTFNAYSGAKLVSVLEALNTTESHYNFGLFLEQRYTAAILGQELEEMGGKVDRGWELMDTKVVEEEEIQEDGTPGTKKWVETTIRRAIVGDNTRQTESKVLGVVDLDAEEEGKRYETQVVRSQYLLATDGGKSVVRHKLNIGFPGRTVDNDLIICDAHVDSDIPTDRITVINGVNNRTMAFFPLQDGQIRIILDNGVLTPEEHAAIKPEELTLDKFESLAAACVAPAKFKCLSTSWLTHYRVNEREAEHFSHKNKIFLAGDAAHVHSPAGGQGMNMGLQDSYNLTWKLALVMHGLAPESLLDTYELERQPVAAAIIKMSSRMLQMGLAQDWFRRTFRNVAIVLAPYILPYLSVSTNPVMMLAIRYHDNAINQRSKSQNAIGEEYQVGQRARDGELRVIRKQDLGLAAIEGASVRLHELTVGPGIFHVLVFASDMLPLATPSSTSTPAAKIKGVESTDAEQLAKNIGEYLGAWRARWAYKSTDYMAGSADPVLLSKSTSTSSDDSLSAVPHPVRANHLFMVHVLASDLSAPQPTTSAESTAGAGASATATLSSATDVLSENQPGEGKIYLDHLGAVHEKYGVAAKHGPGAIVVVRPDAHIGFRVLGASTSAWKEIDQYLESILL